MFFPATPWKIIEQTGLEAISSHVKEKVVTGSSQNEFTSTEFTRLTCLLSVFKTLDLWMRIEQSIV